MPTFTRESFDFGRFFAFRNTVTEERASGLPRTTRNTCPGATDDRVQETRCTCHYRDDKTAGIVGRRRPKRTSIVHKNGIKVYFGRKTFGTILWDLHSGPQQLFVRRPFAACEPSYI